MTENNAAQAADQEIEAIMEQAQVFASAWAFLGGPFDNGSGLEQAERERSNLRTMLSKLRAEGVQAGEPVAGKAVAIPLRPLTEDERAAIEFYTLNPTAAVRDLDKRLSGNAATPPACDHQFHFFGDQVKERRCVRCNVLESKASAPVAGESVCKGSMALGSGCGACERCKAELQTASAPVAGEAIYQIKLSSDTESGWHDATEGAYWTATEKTRRIVFVAPQASEADDDESASDAWRRLALQFDEHRMMAKHHIHMMLANPELHANAAQEFLAAPPLSGEQVLADRIAAIAKTQADKDDGDCAKGAGVPSEPLRVFSAGIWTYDGTGQAFSHTDLDAAAFVTYRDALSPTSSVVKQSLTATQTGEKGVSDA